VEPTKPGKHDIAATAAEPKRLSSKDLFGQATRLRIAHGDCEYLLQITRQGKLILTK
jgi:hemin uptake protein HemP